VRSAARRRPRPRRRGGPAAAACGCAQALRLPRLAPERARWHSTTVGGVVGAAGAAARLLGTDEADAVAHAASVTGGSSYALVERTGTRFLHRAHAASSGVACARAQLPASRGVLESDRGAFAAVDAEVLLRAARGDRSTRARSSASRRLCRRPPPSPSRRTPPPADDEERWWSIEHAVAVALGSPDLCSRVELAPGQQGWGATVEVRLGDGTARATTVEGPRTATDDVCARSGDGSPGKTVRARSRAFVGTVVGALLLEASTNGLTLIGVGTFAQLLFVDVIIITAVAIDRWTSQIRRRADVQV
jgi:hypothetical protein